MDVYFWGSWWDVLQKSTKRRVHLLGKASGEPKYNQFHNFSCSQEGWQSTVRLTRICQLFTENMGRTIFIPIPKHHWSWRDTRNKTQDRCALHKMLSNKIPGVSDQKESFLTLLWSSLELWVRPANLNFSFTWKSHRKIGSPSKLWGCHTILISCLLGGKIIYVCLTSVSKVRGEKKKKRAEEKKSIWLWKDFDESDALAADTGSEGRIPCPWKVIG